MSDPGARQPPSQLGEVRGLVTHATSRLLGDTIGLSDEDWRAASRLPGWTRGHVATHLARQADGLTRLATWARTGERQEMYASPEARDAEIADGAGRPGLELQVDLDTSAGRLGSAFDALDGGGGWNAVVTARGGLEVSARLLPLMRLGEVVLHHLDLGTAFTVDAVDETTAQWLLELAAFRLGQRSDFPALRLVPDSGSPVAVGVGAERRTVSGPTARLVAWLGGRAGADGLTGADGIELPPY